MAQQPASVVFAMNDTDAPTAYVATEGAFSAVAFEMAEGLAITGAKNITKPGGEDSGILALKVSNNSGEKTDLLTWSVQPVEGITFTPTHVKGYINRDGTDQEKSFTISVKKVGGEAIELGTYTAWRQGKDANQKDYDVEAVYMYDIELTAEQQAELAGSEGFVLMSTVGVPSGKSAFFGEVTIEGTIEAANGEGEEPEGEGTVVEGYKYALTEGEAHASGDVVTLKVDGSVVATLTYGEAGGADFAAATANSSVEGYTACTNGNNVNGDKEGGTFYTIAPTIDAKISVAVVLNADKAFFILEDGTALAEYNGIKEESKYYGTYTFNATAGKSYKVYCSGSKLGFYGFEMSIGPTGIEAIEAKASTGVSYDLMGRRATDKGLMIRDGKVILVK